MVVNHPMDQQYAKWPIGACWMDFVRRGNALIGTPEYRRKCIRLLGQLGGFYGRFGIAPGDPGVISHMDQLRVTEALARTFGDLQRRTGRARGGYDAHHHARVVLSFFQPGDDGTAVAVKRRRGVAERVACVDRDRFREGGSCIGGEGNLNPRFVVRLRVPRDCDPVVFRRR